MTVREERYIYGEGMAGSTGLQIVIIQRLRLVFIESNDEFITTSRMQPVIDNTILSRCIGWQKRKDETFRNITNAFDVN